MVVDSITETVCESSADESVWRCSGRVLEGAEVDREVLWEVSVDSRRKRSTEHDTGTLPSDFTRCD